ncbi:hypothetical protein BHE90_007159 [Fusarium euwallaceae]|uniref:Uncharacterized protein n=1 Tax=Fusarium euwallaceae TaxID=1147111 RepID=A0A430LRK6_9HYPO|nr:hypothetical protein BHE90_007159 [Fusarium euwallaceae]
MDSDKKKAAGELVRNSWKTPPFETGCISSEFTKTHHIAPTKPCGLIYDALVQSRSNGSFTTTQQQH